MGSKCTYSIDQWQCPLSSESNSSFCCLHDGGLHPSSKILDNLHQLSLSEHQQLLAYELRDFESSKLPAIRFKKKNFHQGLWSSLKWRNDFFISCNFVNLELENVTMEACVLEEFLFKNCKLYGFNNSRSNWLRGTFENIESHAEIFRLEEIKIENCLFSACDWQSISLYNCKLREVYFADCVFKQASFLHCDFIDCKFEGNSGILAMENCQLKACEFNEPEEQLLISKVNCLSKS